MPTFHALAVRRRSAMLCNEAMRGFVLRGSSLLLLGALGAACTFRDQPSGDVLVVDCEVDADCPRGQVCKRPDESRAASLSACGARAASINVALTGLTPLRTRPGEFVAATFEVTGAELKNLSAVIRAYGPNRVLEMTGPDDSGHFRCDIPADAPDGPYAVVARFAASDRQVVFAEIPVELAAFTISSARVAVTSSTIRVFAPPAPPELSEFRDPNLERKAAMVGSRIEVTLFTNAPVTDQSHLEGTSGVRKLGFARALAQASSSVLTFTATVPPDIDAGELMLNATLVTEYGVPSDAFIGKVTIDTVAPAPAPNAEVELLSWPFGTRLSLPSQRLQLSAGALEEGTLFLVDNEGRIFESVSVTASTQPQQFEGRRFRFGSTFLRAVDRAGNIGPVFRPTVHAAEVFESVGGLNSVRRVNAQMDPSQFVTPQGTMKMRTHQAFDVFATGSDSVNIGATAFDSTRGELVGAAAGTVRALVALGRGYSGQLIIDPASATGTLDRLVFDPASAATVVLRDLGTSLLERDSFGQGVSLLRISNTHPDGPVAYHPGLRQIVATSSDVGLWILGSDWAAQPIPAAGRFDSLIWDDARFRLSAVDAAGALFALQGGQWAQLNSGPRQPCDAGCLRGTFHLVFDKAAAQLRLLQSGSVETWVLVGDSWSPAASLFEALANGPFWSGTDESTQAVSGDLGFAVVSQGLRADGGAFTSTRQLGAVAPATSMAFLPQSEQLYMLDAAGTLRCWTEKGGWATVAPTTPPSAGARVARVGEQLLIHQGLSSLMTVGTVVGNCQMTFVDYPTSVGRSLGGSLAGSAGGALLALPTQTLWWPSGATAWSTARLQRADGGAFGSVVNASDFDQQVLVQGPGAEATLVADGGSVAWVTAGHTLAWTFDGQRPLGLGTDGRTFSTDFNDGMMLPTGNLTLYPSTTTPIAFPAPKVGGVLLVDKTNPTFSPTYLTLNPHRAAMLHVDFGAALGVLPRRCAVTVEADARYVDAGSSLSSFRGWLWADSQWREMAPLPPQQMDGPHRVRFEISDSRWCRDALAGYRTSVAISAKDRRQDIQVTDLRAGVRAYELLAP